MYPCFEDGEDVHVLVMGASIAIGVSVMRLMHVCSWPKKHMVLVRTKVYSCFEEMSKNITPELKVSYEQEVDRQRRAACGTNLSKLSL